MQIPAWLVGLFYGTFVGLAALGCWAADVPGPLTIGPGRHPTWVNAAIGLGVGLAIVAATRVGERLPALARMNAEIARTVGPVGVPGAAWMATCSAVGEELLFRGFLLPWLGLGWSSVLFGAVHFTRDRALWPWVLFAMSVGLGLGALTVYTGDVLAAIVAHLTINYLNLLWLSQSRAPDA